MPCLSAFSQTVHVGGGYEREGKFYLLLCLAGGNLDVCNCVCVCVVFNAVHWFGFSSSHQLILVCQTFLLLLICRNPYGQPVGNHRAGLDHVPRKWGEFYFVCACVEFLLPFFFFFFNSICSICLLIEPSLPWTAHLPLFYIFIFAVYVCFFWILKSKWETHCVTRCTSNLRFFQR